MDDKQAMEGLESIIKAVESALAEFAGIKQVLSEKATNLEIPQSVEVSLALAISNLHRLRFVRKMVSLSQADINLG